MLINLRNALMTGKRLPYDAEVEYLESTGTQYIDTPFIFNSNTDTVEASFSLLDGAVYKWCFGSHDSNARCAVGSGDGTNLRNVAYGNGTTKVQDSYFLNTRCEFVANSQGAYLNSTKIRNGWSFQATSYMRLFGLHVDGDASTYTSKTRLWRFAAKRNGVTILNLIPVRKGTVGYLYDRVSGKLFGNAGTGDFVLGPDVVPVEYIESHGTEYIDTGMVATNSHGFRVDVATAQKSGNVNTRIFGVHEGNVRCGFALYGTTEPSGNDLFWGWNAATGFVADIPQRFVVSLNYKNDRTAIFDGTTNLSSLGTLGNTTKSIYLLNANYNGAPFAGQYVIGRLYKAEISIGSDISNNFIPVRVGSGSAWEGAMMDVLTRRIYRNAGTGAFSYGNDLKYPIPAE